MIWVGCSPDDTWRASFIRITHLCLTWLIRFYAFVCDMTHLFLMCDMPDWCVWRIYTWHDWCICQGCGRGVGSHSFWLIYTWHESFISTHLYVTLLIYFYAFIRDVAHLFLTCEMSRSYVWRIYTWCICQRCGRGVYSHSKGEVFMQKLHC